MTWIIFDEADHYSPAPHFCLPSSRRNQVCLRDYHEDCNLVLVFTQGLSCNECWGGLAEFGARQDDYLSFDAKVLVVAAESVSALEGIEPETDLPFPLLADEINIAREAYAGLMDASLVNDADSMVFVLDRYNAPYTAWIGRDFSDPAIHKEIQGWLSYIGIQCPE